MGGVGHRVDNAKHEESIWLRYTERMEMLRGGTIVCGMFPVLNGTPVRPPTINEPTTSSASRVVGNAVANRVEQSGEFRAKEES